MNPFKLIKINLIDWLNWLLSYTIPDPMNQRPDELNANRRISNSIFQILENCPRLHTLRATSVIFRYPKLYRKLGEISLQFRRLYLKLRRSDYKILVKHMKHLNVDGQRNLMSMCIHWPKHDLCSLEYDILEPNGSFKGLVWISYLFTYCNLRRYRTRWLTKSKFPRWSKFMISHLTFSFYPTGDFNPNIDYELYLKNVVPYKNVNIWYNFEDTLNEKSLNRVNAYARYA